MAVLLPLLGAALLSYGTCANVVDQSVHVDGNRSVSLLMGGLSLQAMEKVFDRSETVHQDSIASITKGMSVPKAVAILQKSDMNQSKLTEAFDLANIVLNVKGAKGVKHLRQPKGVGYSGIDGARQLLNDMIFESMTKYDKEIAKCTEFYSETCAALEVCRGEIAAANYVAANSRALILDAQATINWAEVEIPTKKEELRQHNLKCKHELKMLNDRLKIVMGDVAIMVTILKMTDCDAKSFAQNAHWSVLHCKDECTKKSFVMFDNDGLQKEVNKLKSKVSQKLMADTFQDIFAGIEGLEAISFMQVVSEQTQVPNKTEFNNPPLPRTKVPANPCTDPNMGAPSAADKNAAKCTIKKSPQCYKLQERFLLIQAGMVDERDSLLKAISELEASCEATKQTLETQIGDAESDLSSAQTKLAQATEKEATAGNQARMTAKQNEELDSDLVKQMKKCSDNYINFETELCALKKIRGELYKIKGGGHSAFFQDCEVSTWDPEECTKKCAGGEQKLTRSVLTHPNGGTKCLPLAAMRTCNNRPCPVHCKLMPWTEWAKCSADCGGGVKQRLREVKQAMKFGGKPCGETSETKPCNVQACEKDCELSGWTKWSTCSKDCDGGTQKRQKFVEKVPEGRGKCAGAWSAKRLEYKECHMNRCVLNGTSPALECHKKMDVVLLIDGSGSLGKAGWDAEIIAAEHTVDAFSNAGGQMAVILYSGPRTWGGVRKCTGKNPEAVDLESCGIKIVTQFTDDLKKVKQLVTGLDWPQGSTLTSLALMTAKATMSLGNKKDPTAVIVYTDGRPMSYRKTRLASKVVRKSARLLWVPVTEYAPLKKIKKWATRRWQENVVVVPSFGELEEPAVITHIIADLCPEKEMEINFAMDMTATDFE